MDSRGTRVSAHGFTLIEVAVVLIITSILLAAGLRLLSVRADRAQIDVTRSHQEAIKSALIAYLGSNKRLPCPDTDSIPDGLENRKGSPADPCTAYAGAVPYRDLGLDQAGVLDGWENYMRYVVSPPQSTPPPFSGKSVWMYSYGATNDLRQTTDAAWAFWPTTSTGAIFVKDVADRSIADPTASPPTGAVVVLISYGKNGMGATNFKGATNDSTGAGNDEAANIAPVVTPGPPTAIRVYDRDISDQAVAGHGTFDDLVMVIRQGDLISPLTTNGTLKASAEQALSQANDIVIGMTLATRTSPATNCTYKYTLPPSVTFTGLSSEWGVTYTISAPPTIDCLSSALPGIAYTLTPGDGGTPRKVFFPEITGILGRAGGF